MGRCFTASFCLHMKQYYTYIYKDPLKNMEPFYIGKGCDSRSHHHLIGRYDTPYMNNKIQKMKREGNKPEIEIINVTCENTALRLEQFLISKYGRRDLGTGMLLNMTTGGENSSPGEETRKKYSIRMMGNSYRKGKKATLETKERLSLGKLGNKNRLGIPHTTEIRMLISERTSLALLGISKLKMSCINCKKVVGGHSNLIQHYRKCIA